MTMFTLIARARFPTTISRCALIRTRLFSNCSHQNWGACARLQGTRSRPCTRTFIERVVFGHLVSELNTTLCRSLGFHDRGSARAPSVSTALN